MDKRPETGILVRGVIYTNILSGSRTYILAGIAILSALAHYFGFIDQNSLIIILGILIPAGQITTRLAIGK